MSLGISQEPVPETLTRKVACDISSGCSKPEGLNFCILLHNDFRACPYYDSEKRNIVSSREVECAHARIGTEYQCKFLVHSEDGKVYLKRGDVCKTREGHTSCGIIVNGKPREALGNYSI